MKTEVMSTWSYWDSRTKKEVTVNYTVQLVNNIVTRVFNFFSQPKGYLTEVKKGSEVFSYFETKYNN